MLGKIIGGKTSKKPKGLTNFASGGGSSSRDQSLDTGLVSPGGGWRDDVSGHDAGGGPLPASEPRKASKTGGSIVSKKGKFAGKGTSRPGRRSLRVR